MNAARLAPGARRDLLDALCWIAKDNRVAAQALRDAVAAAARRIGADPEIGAFRHEIADEPYRFLPLTAFPYIIVYNARRSPPRILRIFHGARDIPEILAMM